MLKSLFKRSYIISSYWRKCKKLFSGNFFCTALHRRYFWGPVHASDLAFLYLIYAFMLENELKKNNSNNKNKNKPLHKVQLKKTIFQIIYLISFYFTAQKIKWSFPLIISSVNVTKTAETAGLVTFTEEIPNGKHTWIGKLVEFCIYF